MPTSTTLAVKTAMPRLRRGPTAFGQAARVFLRDRQAVIGLLIIAIVGVIGPGMGNQMFALAVVLVPYSTRVVRTATLSVKPLEFVEAARALGAGSGRLIGRHLLPNVLPPLLVYTSTLVGMM